MKNRIRLALFTALLLPLGSTMANEDAQAIYDGKCSACHVSGVAGAPKLDDAAAWAPRLEKGPEALLASVTNGLGAMPPMGTCNDCTPEQLAAVIELMTAGVK